MVTVGDIVLECSLSLCIGCGKCGKACPSGRNGGIRPDVLVSAMNDADPRSDPAEFSADVWKCLMCRRCSEICPKGADVAGAVTSMRYISASSGGAPARFIRTAAALAAEGRAFPVNDTVNKKRAELGLPEIKNDASSAEELRKIMSATGFRNE